jgi:hypothetical protein
MSDEYSKQLSARTDIKVYTLHYGLQIIGSSYQVEQDKIIIDAPYTVDTDGQLSSLIPYTVVPTVVNTNHILTTSIPNLPLKQLYIKTMLLDKINSYFKYTSDRTQYLN